jgi:uncharacterized membrane protein
MLVYGYLLMISDALLILGGATMFWFSPRLRRNWVLGYGSPRSMINDTAWQAANRFAGTALALLAVLTMILHVSLWSLIESDQFAQTVSVGLVMALPILVMFVTEKYLARQFRN